MHLGRACERNANQGHGRRSFGSQLNIELRLQHPGIVIGEDAGIDKAIPRRLEAAHEVVEVAPRPRRDHEDHHGLDWRRQRRGDP